MQSVDEQVLLSFKVVLEMLRDRGVDTSGVEALGPPELEALSSSQSVFTIEVNPQLFLVYFMTKMKINDFKNAMFGRAKDIDDAALAEKRGKMHIFIFRDELSSQNQKNIGELFDTFQTFHVKELMFNVTRHALVPEHRVVRDPAELEDVMRTYNIKTKAQLPVIHRDDPVAKYHNVQPGEVVRISRPSMSCGMDTYYRVCVP
jgi:DNA-directed RNA polymerase subunit H (RpoH/RPB5)